MDRRYLSVTILGIVGGFLSYILIEVLIATLNIVNTASLIHNKSPSSSFFIMYGFFYLVSLIGIFLIPVILSYPLRSIYQKYGELPLYRTILILSVFESIGLFLGGLSFILVNFGKINYSFIVIAWAIISFLLFVGINKTRIEAFIYKKRKVYI